MTEETKELTEPQKKKKELTDLVQSNIGNFARMTFASNVSVEYVKLHEMHLKSIEIGWITSIQLHSDQESNKIKQHIYKTKLSLATKAKR